MTDASKPGHNSNFVLVAVALLTAAVGVGWGVGQFGKSRQPTPIAEQQAPKMNRGALLYQTSCANCHGPEGRGDGDSAATLRPPPRDFAMRPWRFEPTKESIRRVILTGIPETAMPASQASLADADVGSLVEYVYELATSRPPVTYVPSPDEQLLKAAGFVDLHGTDPPPLTVSDVSGRVIKIADLKGKLVLVNFWGTTCIHCLKEMPSLCKLEAEFASRGLAVLNVCADAEDLRQAQDLLDKQVPGAKGLTDETGLGLARFEVQALPTVWLIGPDGKAIGRTSGAVDWHSAPLMDLINRWLPRPKH